MKKAPFLALLPCALANPLQQKQAQLASLQNQLDSQLNHYQNIISALSQNEASSKSAVDSGADAQAIEQIYKDMDDTTLKLTTLMSRTAKLMQRVDEYNKRAFQELKIKERLGDVLSDEIGRRDRYLEWKATYLSAEEEDAANVTASESYMSLAELQALFGQEKLVMSTEEGLTTSIVEYTKQSLKEMEAHDSSAAKKYVAQFESTSKQKLSAGTCVSIPQSVELVENELHSHYLGVNMIDYASYENGGSVVYTLTSHAYRPAPRNEVSQNKEDKAIEQMYFDQQSYLEDGSNQKMFKDVKQWMQQNHPKEWYANYKLGKTRPYLPQDWERTIDRLTKGNWDEFTPKGVMDALVPDYVYQSLGFGELGQTAGAEVAISSGISANGAATSKQVGQCYPLSMNAVDDPALAYLSRMDGFDLDDSVAALLSGPKYTIRMSHPIFIDAVTLEHRSFPVGVGLKGGESAPRRVRLVGFSPCHHKEDEDCSARGFDITDPIDLGSLEYHRVIASEQKHDIVVNDDNDDATSKRRKRSIQTFPVKGGNWKPLPDLEDDTDETTTSVKSEKQCSFDDLECKATQESPKASPDFKTDPLAEALEAHSGGGECKPNYEDMSTVPDCGTDSTESVSLGGDRNVVAAVSFIIEENWGNPDYTCLYRVQVHGDIFQASMA